MNYKEFFEINEYEFAAVEDYPSTAQAAINEVLNAYATPHSVFALGNVVLIIPVDWLDEVNFFLIDELFSSVMLHLPFYADAIILDFVGGIFDANAQHLQFDLIAAQGKHRRYWQVNASSSHDDAWCNFDVFEKGE